ncbi:MAG: DUF192 domain-containing protein [Armatimonadetes bacterium]|nr:DUF192 domain-containing protein [Armatimonadota bacterium]
MRFGVISMTSMIAFVILGCGNSAPAPVSATTPTKAPVQSSGAGNSSQTSGSNSTDNSPTPDNSQGGVPRNPRDIPGEPSKDGPIEAGLKRRPREYNASRLYQLQELEVVNLSIGEKKFYAYVMDTDSKMMEGMMHIEDKAVDADEAMIFAYPKPAALSFWMKNTRMDLDIAFLNEKRVILNTATMKAFDETGCPSNGIAQFAVEFRPGTLKKIGAKPGMKVIFSSKVKYKEE